MTPLRWLLATAGAALLYAGVFACDVFVDGFDIPPSIHGFFRALLAGSFAISGVATYVERIGRKNRQHMDRRMDALTNILTDAGLRRTNGVDPTVVELGERITRRMSLTD